MLTTGGLGDLDRACDAAVGIVLARGAEALSVRAIAQAMNLTGPALTHRWDSKARLWGLLVSSIGRRWIEAVALSTRDRGIDGLLPATAEDIDDARVWAIIAALGHSDRILSARVAAVVSEERDLLCRELELTCTSRLPDPVVDAVHATALGLRARVISVGEPLSAPAALSAWRLTIAAMGSDGAGVALAAGSGAVTRGDELDR